MTVQGNCDRLAVGHDNYLAAYRRFRNGETVMVGMHPEPTNPYDPHAVMVTVDGQCGGYLAAGPAAKYQPVIARANALGYALICSATFENVGGPTVRLHMPWPEELSRWMDLPDERRGQHYHAVATPDIEAWLKRLREYQTVLAGLLAGQSTVRVPVVCSLESTPSGKYKGDLQIRASVGGATIGFVPAQYRAGNEDFFVAVESGQRDGHADISKFEDRIGVKISVTSPN